MTTVFLTEKQCFICGSKNRYPEIGSTFSVIGSKDLDGRPSQIHRSSVYMWVQRCMSCGYCGPEISDGIEEFRGVVGGLLYKAQLIDTRYPETANAFLCRGMLMERVGRFAQAGWATVYASWVCDDNDFGASAHECRGKALLLLNKARELKQEFAETRDEEDTILIDIHRRQNLLEQARELCERALLETHSNRILDILYYERKLIAAGDTACHTDAEAEDSDD